MVSTWKQRLLMSNEGKEIYVPIESSQLTNLLPKGDEIVYSTLCRVYATFTLGIKSGKYVSNIHEWTSHVLLTKYGFAYSVPLALQHCYL